MLIKSPLEHFEINYYTYLNNLFYDFSLTSGSIYLLSLTFFLLYVYISLLFLPLTATKTYIVLEKLFFFFTEIFKQQISSVRALRFLPIYFSLFLFIFIMNFSSLFVYSVSLTGYLTIAAFLGFSFFTGIFFIGFLNYGSYFFNFFVPKGVPQAILYFIISIEVLSFIIRPFSLSIRLFANMLAGHTLLTIFTQFCAFIIKNFTLFFIIPLILVFLVFLLEIAVSIIQAYIFVSLLCVYLNDVINLH